MITFHNSILEAEQFVDNLRVKKYLSKFLKLHVNSFMPVSRRVNVLTLFKEQKESLISNARCLTEGTNVPAVDMVAFLNPKRSKIDIVQAIGRALRLSPGKDKGYIFLPLFIDKKKNESVQEALERTEYGEIWEVLQALSEQDEDLHNTIQSLRQQKGHDTVIEPAGLDRYIQIQSSDLDKKIKEQLNEAIFVSILEKLGNTWDEMYGKLCKFHDEHGHCYVSVNNCKEKSLLFWIRTQRQKYRKEELSFEKINALNEVTFIWGLREAQWYCFFEKLKEFFNQNGHCNVPQRYREDPILGVWVGTQRQLYKTGNLPKEKIYLLASLRFAWSLLDTKWDENFKQLQLFKEQHGHCNIPKNSENTSFVLWVHRQRKNYHKGKLEQEKIALLASLGFDWSPIDTQWDEKFKQLKLFKEQHGRCNVQQGYKDKSLALWVYTQRQNYSKGKLEQERIDLLTSLEFDWSPLDTQWNEYFKRLQLFKEQHGHCNVPKSYKNKSLYIWVHAQRNNYNRRKFEQEKIELLTSLGFDWAPLDTQWHKYFKQLQLFKEQYGNCNVPKDYKSRTLARWVHTQRKNYKKGKLGQEKIDLLASIGFDWFPLDTQWNEYFKQLQLFKEQHGRCVSFR